MILIILIWSNFSLNFSKKLLIVFHPISKHPKFGFKNNYLHYEFSPNFYPKTIDYEFLPNFCANTIDNVFWPNFCH